MSDFIVAWSLSRKRFVDEVAGLSQAQLAWKIHPDALSIGEMALHVAGVEVLFASQLADLALDDDMSRIRRTATEGVVDSGPFPYTHNEITAEIVESSLEASRVMVEPLMAGDAAVRAKEIKSALGPMIDGTGALARLCFHAAYHQGQAYQIKTAPGFPTT